MRSFSFSSFVAFITLAAAKLCHGDDQAPPRLYFVLHPHAEGTPSPGKPRCIPHTDERAGYPRALSGHSEPTSTPGGFGYYVGGGVPLGHGDCRRPDDGTWGWDDTGCHLFRRRVILGWSQGRKPQGGTGAYRTDGPPVPDPIAGFRSKLTNLHATDQE